MAQGANSEQKQMDQIHMHMHFQQHKDAVRACDAFLEKNDPEYQKINQTILELNGICNPSWTWPND